MTDGGVTSFVPIDAGYSYPLVRAPNVICAVTRHKTGDEIILVWNHVGQSLYMTRTALYRAMLARCRSSNRETIENTALLVHKVCTMLLRTTRQHGVSNRGVHDYSKDEGLSINVPLGMLVGQSIHLA
jgi:hypothetical protein